MRNQDDPRIEYRMSPSLEMLLSCLHSKSAYRHTFDEKYRNPKMGKVFRTLPVLYFTGNLTLAAQGACVHFLLWKPGR